MVKPSFHNPTMYVRFAWMNKKIFAWNQIKDQRTKHKTHTVPQWVWAWPQASLAVRARHSLLARASPERNPSSGKDQRSGSNTFRNLDRCLIILDALLTHRRTSVRIQDWVQPLKTVRMTKIDRILIFYQDERFSHYNQSVTLPYPLIVKHIPSWAALHSRSRAAPRPVRFWNTRLWFFY